MGSVPASGCSRGRTRLRVRRPAVRELPYLQLPRLRRRRVRQRSPRASRRLTSRTTTYYPSTIFRLPTSYPARPVARRGVREAPSLVGATRPSGAAIRPRTRRKSRQRRRPPSHHPSRHPSRRVPIGATERNRRLWRNCSRHRTVLRPCCACPDRLAAPVCASAQSDMPAGTRHRGHA